MPDPANLICQRVAQVRLELFGPRGKAAFAKKLGISASTYDYYEDSRVPPSDILVKIADLAGLDLRWLLTGQSQAGVVVPAGNPILQRAAELLSRHPDAARALEAFLDLLAKSMEFPAKQIDNASSSSSLPVSSLSVASSVQPAGPGKAATAQADPKTPPSADAVQVGDAGVLIPILGRSAAGVPRFWAGRDENQHLTTLDGLIARHAQEVQRRPASLAGNAELQAGPVQIVTMTQPDDRGICEYIQAGAITRRYADAFAVRIDGASMSPEIEHGDLVILSPSVPAVDGQIAVVQLQRQIGVTCKLWLRAGLAIHLVPINETIPSSTIPEESVVWALKVLAKVRP
jgi:transcriptional regulator with XRE-family HTH domain